MLSFKTLPIVCAFADESVLLASRDLSRDLDRLTGQSGAFPVLPSADGRAVRIVPFENAAPGSEAYRVRVDETGVTIAASDALGAAFGVYAFERRCLSVDPMTRLNGLFPPVRETVGLDDVDFSSDGSPSCGRKVRFRGWFLNDEDLLTDFKGGGGKRNIDYPFYQNVMRTDVLDMILETALRCEINLMIPSSFVDLDNPDEEALVRAVTRRGLYVSQHHVEPMGVSYFAAGHYIEKHGEAGETVSFVQNRARMEEIWRYYAKKWAVYGDRVVWQLGLRGKADQSVWKADKSVSSSPAERGELISDAIRTQYDIIRETLGHESFESTATLWMEGAALYGAGYLTVPDRTIVVFSDVGYSQMFAGDFYRTPRKENGRYGVYVHAAFWGHGPHLAEGLDPRKLAFCAHEAWRMRSLTYSICNVSNVRPVQLGARLHAESLADPAGFDAERALSAFLDGVFGEAAEKVKEGYRRYYAAIADFGEETLRAFCAKSEFDYHEYGPLPFPAFPATDGALRVFGMSAMKTGKLPDGSEKALEESAGKLEALSAYWDGLSASLDGEKRAYIERFPAFQTFYLLALTRWCLMVSRFSSVPEEALAAKKEEAAALLEAVIERRKVLETDGWEGWHDGEKKIGLRMTCEKTRRYPEA